MGTTLVASIELVFQRMIVELSRGGGNGRKASKNHVAETMSRMFGSHLLEGGRSDRAMTSMRRRSCPKPMCSLDPDSVLHERPERRL